MAGKSMIGLVSSFLLIGIVAYALIQGGALFADENDLNSSIMNDDVIARSFSDINESLRDVEDDSQGIRSSVETGGGEAEFSLIASIKFALVSMFSIPISVYSALTGMIRERFGVPGFVINILSAILIITGTVLIWRVWKTGQ